MHAVTEERKRAAAEKERQEQIAKKKAEAIAAAKEKLEKEKEEAAAKALALAATNQVAEGGNTYNTRSSPSESKSAEVCKLCYCSLLIFLGACLFCFFFFVIACFFSLHACVDRESP